MRLLGNCDGSSFSGLVDIKTRPEAERRKYDLTESSQFLSGEVLFSLHSTGEETEMPDVGQLARG